MADIREDERLARLLDLANSLEDNLVALGVEHAFIGGIACVSLGNNRTTDDVDVLVNVSPDDVPTLVRNIVSRDERFVSSGLNRVSLRRRDYPQFAIDILSCGPGSSFSWPHPLILVPAAEARGLSVLHPLAIIFSKINRTGPNLSSDRSKTVIKRESDLADIHFLLNHPSCQADRAPAILDMYTVAKRANILKNMRLVAGIDARVRSLLELLEHPKDAE